MTRSVLCALLVLVAACGGNGPTNPQGGGGFDNFRARIDGVAWNAEFPVTAVNAQAGLYSLTGLRATGSNNYSVILTLTNIPGVGTYPLGVNLQLSGGVALISQAPSSGWTSTLNGHAGEVVITTLSATQIAGTYEFLGTPQVGTTGNRVVTEGFFDLPISAGGMGVAPANKGGSARGLLGADSVWFAQGIQILNAGTLTVVLDGALASGVLRNITFSIANMTGSGPYALSSTAPVRTMLVGDGTGLAWSSALTGGNGTVNLTVTADRISGTFTATVIGASGGATGPLTVSGTFSLGRG